MSFKHLNLEERELMYGMLKQGFSHRKIAEKLNRTQSSISREIKRNTKYGKDYLPCYAQKRYERETKRQRYQAPLKNPEIFLYVRQKLRLGWSPEIISGRIRLDIKGSSIDKETIYRYIYSERGKSYQLWKHLPKSRKKRMVKEGRIVRNKGKVPNAVSITKRPKYILKRKQIGHWETDNMEGKKSSKSALSVSIERSTRYTRITKISNQTKVVKTKAVIEELLGLPSKTLTMDNGKENYGHEDISKALDIKIYFCHAYTSQEKGSVERRIKDIRRFIPKGKSIHRVSNKRVQQIEDWINNKPMKCLGYLTPYEKMQQSLVKLKST